MTLLLVVSIYLYTHTRPGDAQKHVLGVTITIPDKDGFEAKMTNIKDENLKGAIKNSQTGEKTEGEVIAYVNKITNLSDDGSSFILPFELNYGNQEKYLYLGIFYFEPSNTSVIGKNDSPKIIRHSYSYLLGENIILEKISNLIAGTYSFTIDLEYLDLEEIKTKVTLRNYYETVAFEIAKNCEEIGIVESRSQGSGKSYDVCIFDNDHECTLEAYDNGNCPIKGYDISITDDPIEKWGISQGFVFKDEDFIFPANYKNCTIDDFYFERCEFN